ncbi:MAG: MFS transporter [Proteobacteria bacterium]|nr:MFS transporter [Pseudomonadota bacterium]
MLEFQKRLTNGFYALVSLPATAMGFALSVQISALSWLLSTKFNLDIHEVGLVWAAGPLAGIFGQLIVGLVSDKVWFWGGRRRPFIFIGGTLAALMLFLLPRIGGIHAAMNGLLGAHSLLIVATMVALTLDLAINVSFNPTRSLIADVTPEGEARTKGFTWMQTISGFWGVAAYAIGATFGNEVLISVGMVLVLLFSILPTCFVAEPRSLEAAHEQSAGPSNSGLAQIWPVFLAHAFSWIGVQTMFVYIIAFIQQRLIAVGTSAADSATQSGQIIAIAFLVLNAVGFLLPGPVFGPIARRLGRVRTHIGALAIMAMGYFAIATLADRPLVLYALMAIVGIGWGAIVSLPFAILSDKVARTRMGLFMGIFNLSVVLPQLFVSLALGKVIQAAPNKNIIFFISGAALAVSALLWLLVREAAPAAGTGCAPAPAARGGH